MAGNFYRFADSIGDSTGFNRGIGDFSALEQSLILKPFGKERILRVNRIIVHIEANDIKNASDYGNIIGGLADGIEVKVFRGLAVRNDLTGGVPIRTNGGWNRVCFDVAAPNYGVGQAMDLTARWTLGEAGEAVELFRVTDDSLVIILSDDFTSLTDHSFNCQGTVMYSNQ